MADVFDTIYIHTRPQVDTVIAIFILQTYGQRQYPGIENANIEILPIAEKSEKTYEEEGAVLIDVGGGKFDHHDKDTTATQLVAKGVHAANHPPLKKLIQIAERDDKHGKGIVSNDRLDRAFGFPGLLMSLNKSHPENPEFVINTFLPVIQGHYEEERRRTIEMPKEYKNLRENGKVIEKTVEHYDKKRKVIALECDNVAMPGWVRAVQRADVVIQKNDDGHTVVLTKGNYIDLNPVAQAIREAELKTKASNSLVPPQMLSQEGRIDPVPEWYYDSKTNTLLNGGRHAKEVTPTSIAWERLVDAVTDALESV